MRREKAKETEEKVERGKILDEREDCTTAYR
jgi:hypothetical protein